MAMNETMASPTDWAKYYQQNLSNSGAAAAAASTVPSIGMITSNNFSSSHGSAPISSSNLRPSEAGRVSKPPQARKRSRASRRTPTTLLNTDTTNFRAMVQQFTGGPNSPLASTPPAQSFGFSHGAAGNHIPNPNPNNGSSLMDSPGYRLQFQPQYQSQGYMISMSNVNNHAAAGDGFFQRLGGNPRPPLPPPEGSDGFLMRINNVSSSSGEPSNSNENRGNGFMF